jgi:hypothetical protein
MRGYRRHGSEHANSVLQAPVVHCCFRAAHTTLMQRVSRLGACHKLLWLSAGITLVKQFTVFWCAPLLLFCKRCLASTSHPFSAADLCKQAVHQCLACSMRLQHGCQCVFCYRRHICCAGDTCSRLVQTEHMPASTPLRFTADVPCMDTHWLLDCGNQAR